VICAFNQRQFDEAKKTSVSYTSLGGGMVVPTENKNDVVTELDALHENHIKHILENNTRNQIIDDAFRNYETQITGDLTDAIEFLEIYGIRPNEVRERYSLYFQHCIDNDLF